MLSEFPEDAAGEPLDESAVCRKSREAAGEKLRRVLVLRPSRPGVAGPRKRFPTFEAEGTVPVRSAAPDGGETGAPNSAGICGSVRGCVAVIAEERSSEAPDGDCASGRLPLETPFRKRGTVRLAYGRAAFGKRVPSPCRNGKKRRSGAGTFRRRTAAEAGQGARSGSRNGRQDLRSTPKVISRPRKEICSSLFPGRHRSPSQRPPDRNRTAAAAGRRK